MLPKEAVALQRRLAGQVREVPLSRTPTSIAAVDVSVRDGRVRAAVVVVSLPDLSVVDQAIHEDAAAFPYVPGLLSFREIPAVLPALDRLRVTPDVLMTDGQGRAHPRRFGLACHLGLLMNVPTFGVAKTVLAGAFLSPGEEKGSQSPMSIGEDIVGAALRTRRAVAPVYVSTGHLITLSEAVDLTLACTTRYRLPDPARLAHQLSKEGVLR